VPQALVRSEHPRGAYAVRRLRGLAAAFLKQLGRDEELSVLVTTDAQIKRLNGTWRGKRQPTDVLSFGGAAGSPSLGDVVISLDTARRQGRERHKTLSDELARLLAHGVLHLLGHDHEQPAEARRMAKAEIALLGTIGLVGDALAARPSELEFSRPPLRSGPRRSYAARRRTGGRPGRTAAPEKP
jgi:probable rRNA maturation factor